MAGCWNGEKGKRGGAGDWDRTSDLTIMSRSL
jgi:hypothetical protein